MTNYNPPLFDYTYERLWGVVSNEFRKKRIFVGGLGAEATASNFSLAAGP